MNEEEVLRRWKEFYWAEGVYSHWQAFFGTLIGQPDRAEKLCRLGMQLVRGEVSADTFTRTAFDNIIVATRNSSS